MGVCSHKDAQVSAKLTCIIIRRVLKWLVQAKWVQTLPAETQTALDSLDTFV